MRNQSDAGADLMVEAHARAAAFRRLPRMVVLWPQSARLLI